jgi:hypothetical protein
MDGMEKDGVARINVLFTVSGDFLRYIPHDPSLNKG